jgi:hypothetical protein
MSASAAIVTVCCCLDHAAADRILVGHQAVVEVALRHLLEDALDLGEVGELHARAEVAHRGDVAEGPRRPEEPDPERPLQREAPRHEFAEDRLDGARPERSRVALEGALDHLALAMRGIDGNAALALGAPDLHDEPRAAGEELHDLRVDRVDRGAEARQRLVGVARGGR